MVSVSVSSEAAVSLTTNKTSYRVGESVLFTIKGLTVGASYIVGFLKEGNIIGQSLVPQSDTVSGSMLVGDNVVGATAFVVASSRGEILASVSITVSSAAAVTITTDKTSYKVGEYVKWTANNVVPGNRYLVGFIVKGNVVGEIYTASSSTLSGSTLVGDNVVGATAFAIATPEGYVLANHPTEVTVSGGGGGGVAGITITTDKTEYKVGEYVKFTATGVVPGTQYFVGFFVKGNLVGYAFTASSTVLADKMLVGDNVVDATAFCIADMNGEVLAQTAVKVSKGAGVPVELGLLLVFGLLLAVAARKK